MFICRLLACKYSLTRNLSCAYQTLRKKNGMQYRSRCNIFNSFGNALLFRYIYKGKLVKISENIAFLFYKEIYMNYLIIYYKPIQYKYCNNSFIIYRQMCRIRFLKLIYRTTTLWLIFCFRHTILHIQIKLDKHG